MTTREQYLTHGEIEAAAEVFRNRGVDIHLPWEGDLDDRERELFEALRDALMAYGHARSSSLCPGCGEVLGYCAKCQRLWES